MEVKLRHPVNKGIMDEFKGTPYEPDIWDAKKFGLKIDSTHSTYKLNFSNINPLWLRYISKKFIRFTLHTKPYNTAKSYIVSILRFGRFLTSDSSKEYLPADVNRTLILDFLEYLNFTSLSDSTKHLTVVNIRTFIETVAYEGWLPFPKQRIIFERDIPKLKLAIPRFVPESVMTQLMIHLNSLRGDQARAVYVLIETGRRISEICTLFLDCLKEDNSGYPFLEINDKKTKKIYMIPITQECADKIKIQKTWVKESSLEQYGYLFLGSINTGAPHLKAKNFNRIIKKLAVDNNILGPDGKIWNFQAHQFRHTVGTRMINAGVSPVIVQRYLGHETPEMTSRYAHIHDQTLKEAFNNFQGTLKNENKEMSSYKINEREWLRGNIMAQSLPNGHCGLPLTQGRCPHANACLGCTHFRTDQANLVQHEQQLVVTNKILDVAQKNSWHKQIELNKQVKINLEKVINSIKGCESENQG